MVVVFGHIESNRRYLVIWLVFLYKVKFHVYPAGTDFPARPCVIDIFGKKHRIVVAGTKRLELLKYPEELGCDAGKIELTVHLYHRSHHLRLYLGGYIFVHPAGKFRQVLFP